MKTSSMVSMGGFTLGERKMERYLVFGKRENERKQRKMQENKLGPNRQQSKRGQGEQGREAERETE